MKKDTIKDWFFGACLWWHSDSCDALAPAWGYLGFAQQGYDMQSKW